MNYATINQHALPMNVMLTMLLLFTLGALGVADENANRLPRLVTPWAAEVSTDSPLPEYPRPQLRRDRWINLNGKWEYAVRRESEDKPGKFDGNILVPYPIESSLSGVEQAVRPGQKLWYRRSFQTPEVHGNERVHLNFGAVDWHTIVWVNGRQVGEHRGGYDPFSFDITDALKPGDNELVVSVLDPTDGGYQPRGKQVRRPHGIWYTSVTGIWQTVWLEVTPETYIQSLRLTPDGRNGSIEIVADTAGKAANDTVEISIRDGQQTVAEGQGRAGTPIAIHVPNAKLWSPASPHLYDLVIETESGDHVESYFGLRDIALGKDEQSVTRIMLNGEPLFQYGLLDQGWWPDGLYTAPTDEALRYDLEVTKKLGFNMVRKHVKVEPARWYYWCDKVGLLVWQDMPSGDKYISGADPDINRSKESGEDFELELKAMVSSLFNYPSIVMWVPYNEGWGQWDTVRICEELKQLDPTRLVNNASGWTDRGVGDVHDIHRYPGPAMPKLEEGRAAVLGEFGGLGLPLAGHTWEEERNWGYRSFDNKKQLSDAYRKLIIQLRFLIDKGLSAAVYTQTTDVEIEVNGVLTYDRRVQKLPDTIAKLHDLLHKASPTLKTLVPAGDEAVVNWRYTFDEPSDEWFHTDFDDSAWKEGRAAFGGNDPPGVEPRTAWSSRDIWLRRTLDFPAEAVVNPMLRIYHDEDAVVYINGQKIASLTGYTTAYEYLPLDVDQRTCLKPGPLTVAIHCRQTVGGQFIDVGLVDMVTDAE